MLNVKIAMIQRYGNIQDWRNRIKLLANAAFILNKHPAKIKIVIAPEGFLIPNDRVDVYFCKEQSFQIRTQLVKLSSQYPNILFIPGTIAKAFSTKDSTLYKLWHDILPKPEQSNYLDRHKQLGQPNDIALQKWQKMNKNPFVADDNSRCQKNYNAIRDRFLSRYGLDDTRKGNNQITRSLNDYLAYANKQPKSIDEALDELHAKIHLYAYLEGQQIYKHTKESYADDTDRICRRSNARYIYGVNTDHLNYKNRTFGIEICRDHYYGALKHRDTRDELEKYMKHNYVKGEIDRLTKENKEHANYLDQYHKKKNPSSTYTAKAYKERNDFSEKQSQIDWYNQWLSNPNNCSEAEPTLKVPDFHIVVSNSIPNQAHNFRAKYAFIHCSSDDSHSCVDDLRGNGHLD
ncbi:hypothetical protein [Cysteiniphilum litorale]|uniref:hypothetical protein n=1 Tax=Cysteiniphilum litorale TaxID=2056700 RepID=UPI003F881F6B